MEENLESFVTLLNKHRLARPASEDLAHLPDWARRALSKAPDAAVSPVNGKSEAKPKSEIVLAPAAMTQVPGEPPAAPAAEAREPKTILINLLLKGGERSPSRQRAARPTAPILLDEPSRVIEKTIAELGLPQDAAPPKVAPRPAPRKPEPFAAAITDANKSVQPSIASVEAASVVMAPVAPALAQAEKFESGTAEPAATAPVSFAQILTEQIDRMVPLPTAVGQMSVPTEARASSEYVGAFSSLPALATEMPAASRGRRPMAYALAAVAVVAVVALFGAGGYWYARAPDHGTASPVAKTDPISSSALVAAAGAPVAPGNARQDDTETRSDPPVPTMGRTNSPPIDPLIAMVAPGPVTPDKAGSEKAAADLLTDAKPEPTAPSAVQVRRAPAAEPKHADTTVPHEKPATVAKTSSEAAPPPPVKEAKASPTAEVAPAPEVSAKSPATAVAPPSQGSETAPAPPAAATVASKPPVKEVPAQLAMLTLLPASVVPASTGIEPPPVRAMNKVPRANPGMTGEPTWLRNAVPAPPFTGQPRIAIVIDDLGLDRNRTDRAVALKGPVTLSFLAYASDLRTQTDEARRAGHELIVHVPMEPIMRPKYITKTAAGEDFARDELLRRLRWDLNRFDGYVGVSNHMGNQSGSDLNTAETVIGELRTRGLLFLDARVDGGATNVAERLGVPTVSRDVLLDDDMNAAAINQRLAELEKIARQRGTAVAIGHPHDQTLEALAVWLAGLPSKGLQLVPLTAIVKDREQDIAGVN